MEAGDLGDNSKPIFASGPTRAAPEGYKVSKCERADGAVVQDCKGLDWAERTGHGVGWDEDVAEDGEQSGGQGAAGSTLLKGARTDEGECSVELTLGVIGDPGLDFGWPVKGRASDRIRPVKAKGGGRCVHGRVENGTSGEEETRKPARHADGAEEDQPMLPALPQGRRL